MLTPLQEHACPLCGGPNACAVARTGSFDQPCWCSTVQFSEEVLAQVPEPERGKACICQACAERGQVLQSSMPPAG